MSRQRMTIEKTYDGSFWVGARIMHAELAEAIHYAQQSTRPGGARYRILDTATRKVLWPEVRQLRREGHNPTVALLTEIRDLLAEIRDLLSDDAPGGAGEQSEDEYPAEHWRG